MVKNEITEMIISGLKAIISNQAGKPEISGEPIDESTPLFGRGSFIDSLTLVSLIVDLEQELAEARGISVTIADERAMSLEKSPFRTVGTLADYVLDLANEQESHG